MSYDRSLVVICPSAVRDDLLMLGRGVGVEAGLDVELSGDGSYNGSHAWVREAFAALMKRQFYPGDALNRADYAWLPEDWVDGTILYAMPVGFTKTQIDAILDQCEVSVDATDGNGVPLTPRAHFEVVIVGLGLQIVTAEAV